MSIALFDMDGTLADYGGQLKKDLLSLASPDDPKLETDWYDDESKPWIQNRIKLIKTQVGWWEKLPKLQLGFDILKMAKDIGYDIHILTKGPRTTHSAWTEKLIWCQKNIGEQTEVTITFDKSLVYGRVLVDDFPPYMDSWLKRRPRGLGIMPATSYNKDYKHPNVIRCDENNLDEVHERLLMQFKGKTHDLPR